MAIEWQGSASKTKALYVPSRCRGIKRFEDISPEEIADIELVGEDFPPGTYISFTPTFKYLGTIASRDQGIKDVEARIKSGNKLFGSAKATSGQMLGFRF